MAASDASAAASLASSTAWLDLSQLWLPCVCVSVDGVADVRTALVPRRRCLAVASCSCCSSRSYWSKTVIRLDVDPALAIGRAASGRRFLTKVTAPPSPPCALGRHSASFARSIGSTRQQQHGRAQQSIV